MHNPKKITRANCVYFLELHTVYISQNNLPTNKKSFKFINMQCSAKGYRGGWVYHLFIYLFISAEAQNRSPNALLPFYCTKHL